MHIYVYDSPNVPINMSSAFYKNWDSFDDIMSHLNITQTPQNILLVENSQKLCVHVGSGVDNLKTYQQTCWQIILNYKIFDIYKTF